MSKIVVFEDDRTIRTLVGQILESEGHLVETHEDPGPVLDSIDFETVDLVITDLTMATPGEEVIRRIRNAGVKVPIIVMSAHVSGGKTTYLRKLGVARTIAKPFRINDLLEAIEATI